MSEKKVGGNLHAGETTIIGGFIRKRSENHTAGQGVTVEGVRPDEMSQAALAPRKGQKAGRKLKLAVLGIPKDILLAGDPRYAACLRAAGVYRKARTRELFEMHGYVSAGASSLLATAAINLAASRFLYEKFAGDMDLGYLKLAAKLSDSARQNELAAWELAAREGTARKKLAMQDQGIPWLPQQDGGQKKTGRKRRSDIVESAAESDAPPLPAFGGDLQSWMQAVPISTEAENGMERSGSGEVSELQGVPGDAGEPDSGTGQV